MSIADLQTDQQPLEVQQLQAQFNTIAKALVEQTPGLPEALAQLHMHTQMHEELVHLLDDDDIAILHKAFEKFKQFSLVQKEVKAQEGRGRKKKLSENDLANL
jgi:hypothetical protein